MRGYSVVLEYDSCSNKAVLIYYYGQVAARVSLMIYYAHLDVCLVRLQLRHLFLNARLTKGVANHGSVNALRPR